MSASGIHLWAGAADPPAELRRVDAFAAAAVGELASSLVDDDVAVFFEGVLLGAAAEDEPAAVAAAYREGGAGAVADLDGFFRAAVIDRRARRAHLVHDLFATRPTFLYQRAGVAVAAPSPEQFAAHGLRCQLDRQGLYQMCRLCHPVAARSLVREIHRCRPLARYSVSERGDVERVEAGPVLKTPDASLDLVGAANAMHAITRDIVGALLDHPRLRARRLVLPITGGMDSRHLLGAILESGRLPESLVHVHVSDRERDPAAELASLCGIPLDARRVEDLPLPELADHWLEHSAGLAHLHQLYLLGAGTSAPEGGAAALSLDGYLAGFLFGFYLLPADLSQRVYSPVALRLCFHDHRELAAEFSEIAEAELARWQGPATFAARGSYAINRGPGYTGAIFPILPGTQAFAPSAHRRALELYCRIPEEIGAGKRARIEMFRRHYPQLARVASEYGPSYADTERMVKPLSHSAREAVEFVVGLVPGIGRDPAPGTAHQWLRTIPFYRRLGERLVSDSALVRDGHLPSLALRSLWAYERGGGFVGWMLMSLMSAEVAYRRLVLGEGLEDVRGWLGAS